MMKTVNTENEWAQHFLSEIKNYDLMPIDWNTIQNESDEIFASLRLSKNEKITLGQSEFNQKNKQNTIKTGTNDLQNYISLKQWLKEQNGNKILAYKNINLNHPDQNYNSEKEEEEKQSNAALFESSFQQD